MRMIGGRYRTAESARCLILWATVLISTGPASAFRAEGVSLAGTALATATFPRDTDRGGNLRRVDIGIGLFFIAFGLFGVSQSLQLPLSQRGGIPGAGLFPLVLSIALIVLGVLLIVTRLRGGTEGDEHLAWPTRTEAGRVGAAMLAVGASIVLLPVVGYFVSSALLVGALLFGIERRRSWQAGVTTLVLPAVFFLIFVVLLRVRLPAGFLGG
jgi:putative tricarboxylic transport membrane protein